MSGILNVNKPIGSTSFDIVREIRRGTGEKRVGHAGTLDPLATGVLVILLGQAVRISEYLMDLPKSYRATVYLGAATTTYDAEGDVTSRSDAVVSEEQLRTALKAFVGEIMQAPPAFSALKVDGQRAYALARRGDAPVLKQRPVTIYSAEVAEFAFPEAVIDVECGRGTYIRSLAHDLGVALGCGAHLSALARTRVGPFWLERSTTMPDLRARLADGTWGDLLDPVDVGLLTLPMVTVPIEDEKDLRNGRAVTLEAETNAPAAAPHDAEVRAYAEDGSYVGILRFDAAANLWKPRKIFAPEPGRIAY